eukprot:2733610-Pyramimonas_sp.AAC.1
MHSVAPDRLNGTDIDRHSRPVHLGLLLDRPARKALTDRVAMLRMEHVVSNSIHITETRASSVWEGPGGYAWEGEWSAYVSFMRGTRARVYAAFPQSEAEDDEDPDSELGASGEEGEDFFQTLCCLRFCKGPSRLRRSVTKPFGLKLGP